jgi:hypothetical protein
LKGRYYWEKRTPEGLRTAVDAFNQAIVLSPNYVKPYVGLADCYNLLREFAGMPDSEAYPKALAAARKAVELDDTSAEAHAALGFATFWGSWQFKRGEREFQRAIQLDPNYAAAHLWYANALNALGQPKKAFEQIERARELEPKSAALLADEAYTLLNTGKWDEGMGRLRGLASSEPALASPHRYLAWAYFKRRDYPRYLAEAKRGAQLSDDQAGLELAGAAAAGFASGGEQGLLRGLYDARVRLYQRAAGSAYETATVGAALGRRTDSLHYLQLSFAKREIAILNLNYERDKFRDLQSDPEFRKLLAQLDSLQR